MRRAAGLQAVPAVGDPLESLAETHDDPRIASVRDQHVAATPQRQVASNGALANPFEAGFQRGILGPGGGGPQQQQQQQLARVDIAAIENPLVKIAGLILGSPEFQRQ